MKETFDECFVYEPLEEVVVDLLLKILPFLTNHFMLHCHQDFLL